jgi:hypothetical protein
VELSGPPLLKTPIQPSNPGILNTHKEIWDQNEFGLILDIWRFNNPAPVELRSNFKHPQRNLGPKQSWANFRCLVI